MSVDENKPTPKMALVPKQTLSEGPVADAPVVATEKQRALVKQVVDFQNFMGKVFSQKGIPMEVSFDFLKVPDEEKPGQLVPMINLRCDCPGVAVDEWFRATADCGLSPKTKEVVAERFLLTAVDALRAMATKMEEVAADVVKHQHNQ